MDFCRMANVTEVDNMTLLLELNIKRAIQLSPSIVYLLVLLVIGVVGNSFVVYVYGTKLQRTTATYFILSLAVLDLISCTTGLPLELLDIIYNSNFPSAAFCKAARFPVTFAIIASGFTLLTVAMDRYFKICKPQKRPPIHTLKRLTIAAVIFSLSLSWPAPIVFGISHRPFYIASMNYSVKGKTCGSDETVNGAIIAAYWTTIKLLFLGGSVFMIVVYTLLIRTIRLQDKKMMGRRASQRSSVNKRRTDCMNMGDFGKMKKQLTQNQTVEQPPVNIERRTTRLFIAITAVFIISFLPTLILNVLHPIVNWCPDSVAVDNFIMIFIRSQYINNVANPFLYGFYNPRFRMHVKRLIVCKLSSPVPASCSVSIASEKSTRIDK